MMTEDEAKEKWCPFARQVVGDANVGTNGNRDANADGPLAIHDGNRCIGSACMAWRFSNKKLGHSLSHHLKHYPNKEAKRMLSDFLRENPLVGYCGLAGSQS